MTDPTRHIPGLAPLDIAEALRFAVDQRGCAGEPRGDDAILRRDSMALHPWPARDRTHPEHTLCCMRGGQVPALYAAYAARTIPGLAAFEVKPWDMQELPTIDPHGTLLRFGCAPQEIAAHHDEAPP